jgi:hypothetical protein
LVSDLDDLAGIASIIFDADTAFMFVLMALTGFLPILGLIAWLAGQLVGWVVRKTHLYPKELRWHEALNA